MKWALGKLDRYGYWTGCNGLWNSELLKCQAVPFLITSQYFLTPSISGEKQKFNHTLWGKKYFETVFK